MTDWYSKRLADNQELVLSNATQEERHAAYNAGLASQGSALPGGVEEGKVPETLQAETDNE